MFGYEGFLLGGRNPYSARSSGVAVLQFLERKDLMNIFNDFPLDYVYKFTFTLGKFIFSLGKDKWENILKYLV